MSTPINFGAALQQLSDDLHQFFVKANTALDTVNLVLNEAVQVEKDADDKIISIHWRWPF